MGLEQGGLRNPSEASRGVEGDLLELSAAVVFEAYVHAADAVAALFVPDIFKLGNLPALDITPPYQRGAFRSLERYELTCFSQCLRKISRGSFPLHIPPATIRCGVGAGGVCSFVGGPEALFLSCGHMIERQW